MKKLITPILILSILSFSVSVSAQVDFIRTYTLPPNTTITGADVSDNGNLAIVGNFDDKALLVKIDPFGQIEWNKNYSSWYYYWPGPNSPWAITSFLDIAILSDTGFVAVGWGLEPQIQDARRIVMRLDEIGNVMSVYYAGDNGYQEMIKEPSNNILLGGTTSSLNVSKAYISRMELATGIHQGGLGMGSGYSGHRGIGHGSDGSTYLAGISGTGDGFLTRMDPMFNTIWELAWNNYQPYNVVGLDDGSVITANENIIARFLPSGILDWAKTLSVGGQIQDIKLTNTGHLLLAGYSGNSSNAYSWLVKIDSTGNDIWGRRYGNIGDAFLVDDLDLTNNDDIRMTGYSGSSDLLVIATDSSGILSSCQQQTLSYSLSSATISPTPSPPSYTFGGGGTGNQFESEGTIAYVLNSYTCSGETQYVAKGIAFHDSNTNGVLDPGENGLANFPVGVQPIGGYLYTDTLGQFEYSILYEDTLTIIHADPWPFWQLSSDSVSYTVAFSSTDTLFEDLDFGYSIVLDTNILIGSLNTNWAWCGATVTHTIGVSNSGTYTPQGVAELILDTLITFLVSTPPPDSIVGNSYFWSFDSLSWFQNWQQEILVEVPSANNIGVLMQSSLRVWSDDGNGNLFLTDSLSWNRIHTCSYDPNDKSVLENNEPNGAFTPDIEWLTYTIRFQNTGTDTAFNVQIQDQLSQFLDPSSLFVLGSSHMLTNVSINSGGLANFQFDNILLPDSNVNFIESQGYVTYQIRPVSGLDHLDQIFNNAGIFFDLNPAVITNTTVNTYVDCSLADEAINNIQVFNGEIWGGVNSVFDTLNYTMQWYLNGVLLPGETDFNIEPQTNGYYHFIMTDDYGCPTESDSLFYGATVVEEIGEVSIKIIPNPFNERTRIVLSEPLGTNDRLEVIDIHGRIMRSVQGTGSKEIILERGELKSGIYLLKFTRNGRSPVSKRIVVH